MSEPDFRIVDDVAELVTLVELKDVYFLGIAGRRVDQEQPAESPIYFDAVQVRQTETEMEARFDLRVQTEELAASIDVVASYSHEGLLKIGPDAQREFLERVALFAIWPYLRAELAMLCARLRVDIINLGLILQGQITLSDAIKSD